jgi:hypothetical protein
VAARVRRWTSIAQERSSDDLLGGGLAAVVATTIKARMPDLTR